jgi:hypothetical protein
MKASGRPAGGVTIAGLLFFYRTIKTFGKTNTMLKIEGRGIGYILTSKSIHFMQWDNRAGYDHRVRVSRQQKPVDRTACGYRAEGNARRHALTSNSRTTLMLRSVAWVF